MFNETALKAKLLNVQLLSHLSNIPQCTRVLATILTVLRLIMFIDKIRFAFNTHNMAHSKLIRRHMS